MPVVPGPRIATSPLPGAKLSPGAPSAAFGVPTAPDLSAPIALLSQIDQQARKEADETAYIATDNQLHDLKGRIRAAVEEKFRGLNALGATDYAREAWQKGTADILSAAPGGDHVKLAMQRAAATHWGDLDSALTSYAHAEFKNGQAKEFAGAVDNRLADAVANYADPALRQAALDQGIAVITGYAQHNGWGQDETRQRITDFTSAAHMRVMDRMLANDQDLQAAAYLKAHRDELSGKDLVDAERTVGEGSLRGTSQRESDRITQKATSLNAGLAEAAKIEDPRVRDATEARIRRVFADRAAADRQDRELAYEEAGVTLEKTGSVDKIPPRTWLKLSVTERESLQHREDQIRHPKDVGDEDAYLHQVSLATLPNTRAQFLATDVLAIKGLNQSQRERLMALQRRYSGEVGPDGVTPRHIAREAEAEQQRTDHMAEAALRKTDPNAAEKLRAENIKKRDRMFHRAAGAAAPGASTTEPKKEIPAAWRAKALVDPAYAEHLRAFNYRVP